MKHTIHHLDIHYVNFDLEFDLEHMGADNQPVIEQFMALFEAFQVLIRPKQIFIIFNIYGGEYWFEENPENLSLINTRFFLEQTDYSSEHKAEHKRKVDLLTPAVALAWIEESLKIFTNSNRHLVSPNGKCFSDFNPRIDVVQVIANDLWVHSDHLIQAGEIHASGFNGCEQKLAVQIREGRPILESDETNHFVPFWLDFLLDYSQYCARIDACWSIFYDPDFKEAW